MLGDATEHPDPAIREVRGDHERTDDHAEPGVISARVHGKAGDLDEGIEKDREQNDLHEVADEGRGQDMEGVDDPAKDRQNVDRPGCPVLIEMTDAGRRNAVQELGVLIFEIERLGREHQKEPGARRQRQENAAPKGWFD